MRKMIAVPKTSLDLLRCSSCLKYLSRFPVRQSSEGDTYCGRCKLIVVVNTFPARTFETVAQYVKFPCVFNNEGCTETLFPSEVEQHEKNCYYKVIRCPTRPLENCEWHGVLTEVAKHCEDIHPTRFIKDKKFEIDLLNSHEQRSFVVDHDKLYNFYRNYDSATKQFKFSVLQFEEENNPVCYQIVLCNGKRSRTIDFAPKSTSTESEDNTTEVCVDTVREKLDDPAIIIGEIKFSITEINAEDSQSNPGCDLFSPMLEELECMVCQEYMIPPIRICASGHSVCLDCKPSLTKCPTCRGDVGEYQPDIVLKKIANQIIGPCKFQTSGCKYAAKLEMMKDHHRYCKFAPQTCPLKDYETCNWIGLPPELLPHIRSDHIEHFMDFNEIDMFADQNFLNSEFKFCYIKLHSGKLFKLDFLYKEETFYWCLQLIGPAVECKEYKYEITITDQEGGLKYSMRKNCAELKPNGHQFENAAEYIFLTLDQIRYCINDDHFTYKLDISK